jgi:AcrR family transcriptional regulator
MCARPRTVSDEELLEATARAVSRVGPARLTLADVAKEAGVVPATLVQRFGTKRGMLLALMKGLLDDAVTAGELSACDTDALARVVQETLQGSLVAWAIYREGRAGEWVRRDLEFLLSRYLAPKRRSRGQDVPRNAGPAQSVRDHQVRKHTARSQGSDESATSQ